MKSFPVINIPGPKVWALREALERENVGKAPQDKIYYGAISKTFFQWIVRPDGMYQKRRCSRNGKRIGEFFGGSRPGPSMPRYLQGHGRLSFPKWPERANPRDRFTEPVPFTVNFSAEPPPGFKQFVEYDTGEKPDMSAMIVRHNPWIAGRWTYHRPKETTMNALKIALLCYRYDYPDQANMLRAPLGMSPQVGSGYYNGALGELRRDGYIEPTSSGYKLLPKAVVFVKHLLAQPEPVPTAPQWKMPEA